MIYPLLSRCNQRCIFCSGEGRGNVEIDIDDFKRTVLKTNDRLIVFSGGEPFLLPFKVIVYLLEFCLRNKKIVEIQTNATLISKLSENELVMLVKLLNATNGYFNINFPSHLPDIDYKITKKRDAFKDRITSIDILKKHNAVIRITHIINKINYPYLEDFSVFLSNKKEYWNWVQFSFVKAIGRAENNRNVVPKYSDVSPYLIKAMEILESKGFEFWIDHIPLCFLGRFYKHHVDVLKIKKGIKDIYQFEKKKIEVCKTCKFYDICSGPRIDYLKIYNSL